MKRALILAAAAAVLCSCASKNQFVIEGNVAGTNDVVYLLDKKRTPLDSATVENGAFRIKGVADTPSVAYLADARDMQGTFATMVILEPGTITVADNAENPQFKLVSGTVSNDANKAYSEAGMALTKEYRNPETSDERRSAIEKEYEALTDKALEQNLSNFFGAMLLSQQSYGMGGQELLDMIAKFPAELQQTELLTTLKTTAEQKLKTDIGQPYIDVVQNDAQGKELSLKSVVENPENKYVLLDFWASWCGPCMGEVPHLKKTYEEFHKKGFEIFGVSFDSKAEDWTEAVEKNGMDWIHVSALSGFDNQAAKDYAIQGIPSARSEPRTSAATNSTRRSPNCWPNNPTGATTPLPRAELQGGGAFSTLKMTHEHRPTKTPPYRIMGIDPGTNYMGYGVLEVDGRTLRSVVLGYPFLYIINTSSSQWLSRLRPVALLY